MAEKMKWDSDRAQQDRMRMYDCEACGEGKMIDPEDGDDHDGVYYCDVCGCPLVASDR